MVVEHGMLMNLCNRETEKTAIYLDQNSLTLIRVNLNLIKATLHAPKIKSTQCTQSNI